ncbi:hypothetical protein FOL47_000633, partial [Perkinsus chesapeaki]
LGELKAFCFVDDHVVLGGPAAASGDVLGRAAPEAMRGISRDFSRWDADVEKGAMEIVESGVNKRVKNLTPCQGYFVNGYRALAHEFAEAGVVLHALDIEGIGYIVLR